MKKEQDNKNEALDIATGKINSLEDDNMKLIERLKIYSATIKGFRSRMNDEPSTENTDETKKLKDAVKEKNKKLSESEARNRKLAGKLSELEANFKENSSSVDEKYKKVNDKLSAKTKELKNSEQKLKKAENRVKELLESSDKDKKKIAELENCNIRLNLMKDQALDVKEKTRKQSTNDEKADKVEKKVDADEVSKKKTDKCRYENTGFCRRKSECKEWHPKKTCQSFSKLGSCPLESTCEHRHPYGICYDWEKFGSCFQGDSCRHRHPFDILRTSNAPQEPFLGSGSPRGAGGQSQGQAPRRSPGRAHHDSRGNRR